MLCFNDVKQTKNEEISFYFDISVLKLHYSTKKIQNSELDYSCIAFSFNLNNLKLKKLSVLFCRDPSKSKYYSNFILQ